MVTIWNPADEAQDFTLTMFFSGGHYALPLHLEARATRNFNISEIIQNQAPDPEGNLIPPTVHEGGAKLSGIHSENEHVLVGVEIGVYNVRKATCSPSCTTCNGYSSSSLLDTSFGMIVNATKQQNFIGTYGTGTQYNWNGYPWSSNATSVATVQSGLVSGVSPGSAGISAITDYEPIQEGYICTGPGFTCPTTRFSGSSPGSVISLSCSAVIRGNPTTCSVSGAPSGATFSNWKFSAPNETDVNGSITTSSWAGTMVKSGTVNVSVTIPGAASSTTLSQTVTVLPRSNWGFGAAAASKQGITNQTSTSYVCMSAAGSSTISVSNPPDNQSGSDDIGYYCDIEDFTYHFSSPITSGPNQGYAYIVDATNQASFNWIIAADADNPASNFYAHQCGNYSLNTNTGFISGAQLQSFTTRHESSSTDGHYGQYVSAQNDPNNNLGTTVESVAHVFTTSDDFINFVKTSTATQTSAISAKTKTPEPCNVNSDDSLGVCTYKGPINFAPNYATCP